MDPRKTLINYHNMYNTKGKLLDFPPIDFNHFFDLFKEGQLFEGDWFDTTLSFLPYVGSDNFLFLRYEQVATDQRGTVRNVADFFGIHISERQLDELVGGVQFDVVADWRLYFSNEKLQWYRRKYEQMMKGTDLETTYL